MRARLSLAGAGIKYELREVVLRNKPQELIQASPKATVPVLVLDSQSVIDESFDIMLWALRQHDPQHWLQPEQGNLDTMLALVSENDGQFKHNLDRYKYPDRFDLESGIDNRNNGAQWLLGLNQRLTQNAFLFGSQPSLADMAIAPFVRQYAHTDRDWFYAQDWQHLAGWLQSFMANPLFERVMAKHKPWEPGQPALIIKAAQE